MLLMRAEEMTTEMRTYEKLVPALVSYDKKTEKTRRYRYKMIFQRYGGRFVLLGVVLGCLVGVYCLMFRGLSEDTAHGSLQLSDTGSSQVPNVRILCWVMTSPVNHKSHALHIMRMWGKRCTIFLFVSEQGDVELPVEVVKVEEGRGHLTAKTMMAFDHLYEHHLNESDWFLKADDNTYVIVENLRYFLSNQDPDEPIYFGHHYQAIVKPQGYFSGGAGYVLSREALSRFGRRSKNLCSADGGAEDVEMGQCMQKLGVKTGDSRDSLNRSRFHCFAPYYHVHGHYLYPDWYVIYDKYGAKSGIDAISDYAISFHYVSIPEMYRFEFFLYHFRTYGIISKQRNINRPHKSFNRSVTRSIQVGWTLNADGARVVVSQE